MGKCLKILMMGGQRVGKSSALAAIIDSFVSGPVSNILTAKDITVLQKQDGVKQETISSKLRDTKQGLINNCGRIVLADSGKTNKIWDYTIEFAVPESTNKLTMQFTDINGEFFEEESSHRQEMLEMISGYDVFVIAIDTPFMMEARNNGLVDSVINEKYNCIESIHTFLTMLNDSQGTNQKLVMFVPIKCELWAQRNELDKVVSCVKEDYKTAFTALYNYQGVQVEIVPIQTIGSMVFKEHKDAFLFDWVKTRFIFFTKNMTSKCAKLENGNVRLGDGTEMRMSDGTIKDDLSAVLIQGTDIVRPNSWFKVNSQEYKPHNCDQLAFHILEFMFAKYVDAAIRKKEGRDIIDKGLDWLGNAFLDLISLGHKDFLKDVFGSISPEIMQNVINALNANNLVKYEGEGITIVERCNFKRLGK